MPRVWYTPAGRYYDLYADLLRQPHVLIAGATGSGKSTVINALIHTALLSAPSKKQLILVDVKRVELVEYKPLPHTVRYADDVPGAVSALAAALAEIESRYRAMQWQGVKLYDGADLYVVIDELADLMTTAKRTVTPLLQRIGQIGRAARVHMIVATQCPLREVIPTAIKCNFDARIALRTASRQDSRNIIDTAGAELLPDPRTEGRAQGYYRSGCKLELYNLPRHDDNEIRERCRFWIEQTRWISGIRNKRKHRHEQKTA